MSKPEVEDKRRNRRLGTVAITMFLLAIGVFGGLTYLQLRAGAPIDPATAQNEELEQKVEATRPARLAKIKELREKWRPWAEKHKELLKRMLNAKLSDRVALMAVYSVIPATPDASDKTKVAGITRRDLVPDDPAVLVRTGAPSFTWQPLDKLSQPKMDPKFKETYRRQKLFIAARLQENFARLRDIELSRSVNVGRSQLSLWASGRITESEAVRQPYRNGHILVDGPHQEVQPPYDFLN